MTNNNVGEKQNVNQKCEFIAVVSVRNEKGKFSHLNYVQQLLFASSHHPVLVKVGEILHEKGLNGRPN